MAELPARGSQLISKGTQVGIFARRPDLHQAERNGEQSEEGHETFLAALVGRQPAI
jgi:hypothetical protein